ncbi:MAG: hypothetical protein HY599_04715 [Candidatus Omnitrophica bacterium]|nr:hypothetical protein [Candidatus Omnitrophota bacterium]
MQDRLVFALRAAGAALAATLFLTGCEEIVYRDREPFSQPLDASSGFLGYYTPTTRQTNCGNCHAEKQAEWLGTKHANAWTDLQASGHAQDFCNSCHTTNEAGNLVAVAAGFSAVQDSVYYDVQCESCHGPGVNHLAGPETNQLLASIAVDTGITNGCGECHTGAHDPFVDEWVQSPHGYASSYVAEGVRDPCANCHEGRRALGVTFAGMDPRLSALVAVKGTYLEANDPIDAEHVQPITCAVCHDPHSASKEGQLRREVGEAELTQLCVSCHRREGAPEPSHAGRRGPHAAQGLIVIDEEAGWKPSGWPYTERLLPTHSINERGCAACHVTPFTINDASGNFVKNYTGHLFAAIPCIDQATGEPIRNGTCSLDQRYFGGCTVSGCHGSAEAARTAFEVLEARMDYLTDQLWADTDGDAVMETTDRGLLPKVLAQAVAANNLNALNLYDTSVTDAERSIWNAQLAASDNRLYWFSFKIQGQNSCNPVSTSSSDKCPGTLRSNTGHRSSGGGVHNPFFLEALLTETIKAIQAKYAVAPDRPVDLTVHAAPPRGVRTASR